MPADTMLDHAELRRRLGCSRSTAYALTATGALPSVRLGRAVRIPESAYVAFVAAGGIAKLPPRPTANGNGSARASGLKAPKASKRPTGDPSA